MTEPVRSAADLTAALDREVEGLEREISEIELLVTQARSESGRHEQKRAHLAEKLAALSVAPTARDRGPERPAHHAHEARRHDGRPDRRPAGQAEGPHALSRRAGEPARGGSDACRTRGAARCSGGRPARDARGRGLQRDVGRDAPPPAIHPGGPPPRHRTRHARRTRAEPDEHRAPDADRGASHRPRSGRGSRGSGRAGGHGPADAGRDEDVHLRRPAHGARRPGPRSDASPGGPRSKPARPDPGGVRLAGHGPTPARSSWKVPSSESSTSRSRRSP